MDERKAISIWNRVVNSVKFDGSRLDCSVQMRFLAVVLNIMIQRDLFGWR